MNPKQYINKLINTIKDPIFIMISWYISKNLWYIPVYYYENKIHISSINNTDDIHIWYHRDEPDDITFNNMNININWEDVKIISNNNQRVYYIVPKQTTILLLKNIDIIKAEVHSLYCTDMLNRQNKRTEILLNEICASIRTPLNGILHMTNMLISKDRRSSLLDSDNDYLKYLNESSVTLANNIFDIIDHIQLNTTSIKIKQSRFSIRELMENIAEVTNINVDETFYIEPSVHDYVIADKKRLKQIILNVQEYLDNYTVYIASESTDGDNITTQYQGTEKHQEPENTQLLKIYINSDDELNISDCFLPPEITYKIPRCYNIKLLIASELAQALNGYIYIKTNTFVINIPVTNALKPSETLYNLALKHILLIDIKSDVIKDINKLNANITYTNANELKILYRGKHFDMIIFNNSNYIHYLKKNYPISKLVLLSSVYLKEHKNLYIVKHLITKERIKKILYSHVKPSLLYVDDMENTNNDNMDKVVMREILNQLLDKFNISTTKDIENADLSNYNVILLNISDNIPIEYYFDLAKKIYKIKKIKILGIASKPIDDMEKTRYLHNFIYKPFTSAQLGKKIKKILKHSI